MPVRSSVCFYSPSSVSNSKYSAVLPTPSSLSVGHYKPLSSSSYASKAPSTYAPASSARAASALGSAGRHSLPVGSSSASYSPSSLSANNYHSSSIGSTASSFASSSSTSTSSFSSPGSYRPLTSAHNSLGSARYGSHLPASSTGSTYSRISTASSTGSTSSSSLSSAGSLLDRADHYGTSYLSYRGAGSASGSGSGSGSGYTYQASPVASRRLSHTSSLAAEPLPEGVPRGLVNLGNTCYMNAVIQSLYAVESFRYLILRASHDKLLTSELSDLFKAMKNSSGPVSPSSFKYAFSRHQAKFSGLGQQDSQEFLRYLINGVHEEANQAARRPRRSAAPAAPKSAEEAWSQYRDIVDDSPLVELLVGQLCSTIICSVCKNKSSCWDPFWDLSLPLVRGRHSCRLSEVLQDFSARETLDSDERPVCSSCKQATRSTKQISFCRLPRLLILHLKKFTNDGYKLTSPEIRIDKALTLNQVAYNLKACISHHGHSSSSGHYTSHCEYSSRWFHFNDDRVRDVTGSFDGAGLSDAYVLFYTQASGQSSSLNQSKL